MPIKSWQFFKSSTAVPIHSTSLALFEGSHPTVSHVLNLPHQMMSEEALRSEPWAVLDSKADDGISLTSHCSVSAPAFCYELLSGSTRNLSTEVDTISLKFICNLFFFCIFLSHSTLF